VSKKKRSGALNTGSKRRRSILNRVAERDNWTCFRCEQPVMRQRIKNHPMAPSLDHVVRHTDGGSNSIDNLRLSHRSCNSNSPPHN
jgi:hypothetical protein